MLTDIVILAAGGGRRLRSAMPKPLISLGGEPLLAHVLRTARRLSPRQIVVVTPPASPIADCAKQFAPEAVCATQPVADGTGGALRRAMPKLRDDGTTLTLCADAPLLLPETLRKLCRATAGGKSLALLTFIADSPAAYGRIVRAENGTIARIVEERGADAATRRIKEVYAGVMSAPSAWLRRALRRINNDNAAGEYYLTDIVALAAQDGLLLVAVSAAQEECFGINTPADLECAERLLQRRRAAELLRRGARLADAARIEVRGEIKIGRDVDIDINVIFEGKVVLGDNCRIGAHCILRDCRIGANTVIHPFSHLTEARVGADCQIGPYARLRDGATLADSVKIGNFVEVKKSQLKSGVKACHLAYLGDSEIGERVNIGAGVITCNYDGKTKHKTIIGDGAFIGSDAQLIAPLKIGRGAYVAAGSTITKSVPPHSLALGRAKQTLRKLVPRHAKRRG